jgi:hypothetical protein
MTSRVEHTADVIETRPAQTMFAPIALDDTLFGPAFQEFQAKMFLHKALLNSTFLSIDYLFEPPTRRLFQNKLAMEQNGLAAWSDKTRASRDRVTKSLACIRESVPIEMANWVFAVIDR